MSSSTGVKFSACTCNINKVPTDVLRHYCSYLGIKSMKFLARTNKFYFIHVKPLIKHLIDVKKQCTTVRDAIEVARHALVHIWDPDPNQREDVADLNYYDIYLVCIFSKALRTGKTTVADFRSDLREHAINKMDVEPAEVDLQSEEETAILLSALHLHTVSIDEPAVLNQLGLKLHALSRDIIPEDEDSECLELLHFAIYCFAELVLRFPTFAGAKKNFHRATKALVMERELPMFLLNDIVFHWGLQLRLPQEVVMAKILTKVKALLEKYKDILGSTESGMNIIITLK